MKFINTETSYGSIGNAKTEIKINIFATFFLLLCCFNLFIRMCPALNVSKDFYSGGNI